MKCYISKICKVTYGKYPYTLIVNFKGEKIEMEKVEKLLRKNLGHFIEPEGKKTMSESMDEMKEKK